MKHCSFRRGSGHTTKRRDLKHRICFPRVHSRDVLAGNTPPLLCANFPLHLAVCAFVLSTLASQTFAFSSDSHQRHHSRVQLKKNGRTIAPSTVHPPLPHRRLSIHRAIQIQGLPQGQGDHHHWYLPTPPPPHQTSRAHTDINPGAVGVIGQGLAESFAVAGAKLILTYNNTPQSPALSARCLELGASSVEFIKCNVASLEGCQDLVNQVRQPPPRPHLQSES